MWLTGGPRGDAGSVEGAVRTRPGQAPPGSSVHPALGQGHVGEAHCSPATLGGSDPAGSLAGLGTQDLVPARHPPHRAIAGDHVPCLVLFMHDIVTPAPLGPLACHWLAHALLDV